MRIIPELVVILVIFLHTMLDKSGIRISNNLGLGVYVSHPCMTFLICQKVSFLISPLFPCSTSQTLARVVCVKASSLLFPLQVGHFQASSGLNKVTIYFNVQQSLLIYNVSRLIIYWTRLL